MNKQTITLTLLACLAIILAFLFFSVAFNRFDQFGIHLLALGVLLSLFIFFRSLFHVYLKYTIICLLLFYTIFLFSENKLNNRGIYSSKELQQLSPRNYVYADSNGILVANPEIWEGINQHGFRSREFTGHECPDSIPKVLFLGDSFTWGYAAEPWDSSFVSLVDETGYCTFNTGIPGGDPAQYALVAKLYIPVIKPDIVLTMLYMGNDVMLCERIIKPYSTVAYGTWIENFSLIENYRYDTCPEVPFKNFQIALEQQMKRWNLYEPSILGNTALGTQIAKYFKEDVERPLRELPSYSVSDTYLQDIQDICDEYSMPHWIVVIPDKYQLANDIKELKNQTEGIFEEFDSPYILMPSNITWEDFPENDVHLNNSGHKKYANYMRSMLDQYFKKKPSWLDNIKDHENKRKRVPSDHIKSIIYR